MLSLVHILSNTKNKTIE